RPSRSRLVLRCSGPELGPAQRSAEGANRLGSGMLESLRSQGLLSQRTGRTGKPLGDPSALGSRRSCVERLAISFAEWRKQLAASAAGAIPRLEAVVIGSGYG